MGTIVEEPMLTRLDRLDNILKHLEEIRGGPHGKHSPRSSYESTQSSDGQGALSLSSVDFSPKSMEKHCRPIDDVIVETERKGTLLERLMLLEDRVIKMCEEMEEELRDRKARGDEASHVEKKHHKKGLKQLVKKCIPNKGRKTKEQMVV